MLVCVSLSLFLCMLVCVSLSLSISHFSLHVYFYVCLFLSVSHFSVSVYLYVCFCMLVCSWVFVSRSLCLSGVFMCLYVNFYCVCVCVCLFFCLAINRQGIFNLREKKEASLKFMPSINIENEARKNILPHHNLKYEILHKILYQNLRQSLT